jgi:hypothetical protein
MNLIFYLYHPPPSLLSIVFFFSPLHNGTRKFNSLGPLAISWNPAESDESNPNDNWVLVNHDQDKISLC